MKLAMVGLGRMGMNMAKRLLQGGHEVVAYNRTPQKTDDLVKEGAEGAYSLLEVVDKLASPRIVWLMLPAGATVDKHVETFGGLLSTDDIIIDGGNTYYKDDIRRAEQLAGRGPHYVDVGVSGGIWGLKIGYCLMAGGEKKAIGQLEPIFKTLAPEDGYLHVGKTGAGHFVKMVHNGIEYGMMQAYGEGFEIMEASQFGPEFDFAAISHLWNQGSVVRSWLLELAADAFRKNARIDDLTGQAKIIALLYIKYSCFIL